VNAAGLPDLLGMTGGAAERAIDLQALPRQSGSHLGIQLRVVHQVGGLLRGAELQLRLEDQAEPGKGQRGEDTQENERAMVHRVASASSGPAATLVEGTQHSRQ